MDLFEYNDLNTSIIYPNQKIYLIKTKKKEIAVKTTPKREEKVKDKAIKNNKLKIIWPAEGNLTSNFGKRGIDFHKGIDIAGIIKSKIYAVEKGKVVFSGQQKGYGNLIVLEHF